MHQKNFKLSTGLGYASFIDFSNVVLVNGGAAGKDGETLNTSLD